MTKRGAKQTTLRISGVRALAKAVGKSHTAVARWLDDERWLFGRGPWAMSDVPRIRDWATATLKPQGAKSSPQRPLSPSQTADLELKRTKQQSLKFDLLVKAGKYHLVEDCQKRIVAIIRAVRSEILAHARSSAAAANLTPDQVVILEGRALEICNRFARGLQSEGQ